MLKSIFRENFSVKNMALLFILVLMKPCIAAKLEQFNFQQDTTYHITSSGTVFHICNPKIIKIGRNYFLQSTGHLTNNEFLIQLDNIDEISTLGNNNYSFCNF